MEYYTCPEKFLLLQKYFLQFILIIPRLFYLFFAAFLVI